MTLANIKQRSMAAVMASVLALLPIAATAQTRVSLPNNRYNVQQDVELGQKAAAEIEQVFPVLNDREVTSYVQRVGGRLVAAIPAEFRQPAFNYNFQVVNASDINAFALPGGPMYVNRGMIEAARNEGEMAGVMAHEISHVALRHATAQATRQSRVGTQLGILGAVIGGAILGGQTGAQLGMLGAQVWQTRYSRAYETDADLLGARIMANAGYDPRDLANMFQTIAQQGGGRGPEWLSSHPDPGNRFQKINAEAQRLNVSPTPIKQTREFERAQARLRSMPPAQTMAQLQQAAQRGQSSGTTNPMGGGRYSNNVPVPSTRYRAYSSGNWLRMNVPSNWREFAEQTSVTFAPDGAYGNTGITHGAMIGIYRGATNNLSRDTQALVQGLLQANNYLRQQGGYQNTRLGGRQALATTLSGRSPVNGRIEVVNLYTAQLQNGEVFYFAAVAPQDEGARYNNAFRTIMNSIRFSDSRL